MIGGPLACPPTPPDDPPYAMRTGATFRMIKRQDTPVATPSVIHAMIEKGMTDKTTAGMNGTKEYPYKQIHSTSCKAFMDMQHVVVNHKMIGNPKAKLVRMEAACNK
jgi:hypothetical protein